MVGKYCLKRSLLEKCGENMEKGSFFWAARVGLGKYCMGCYGRIGVYRVNLNVICNKYMG